VNETEGFTKALFLKLKACYMMLCSIISENNNLHAQKKKPKQRAASIYLELSTTITTI
jgi:hypothetical protein